MFNFYDILMHNLRIFFYDQSIQLVPINDEKGQVESCLMVQPVLVLQYVYYDSKLYIRFLPSW